MKDDRLYLIHVTECIERIESYMSGVDREEFLQTPLVQDAVIRNLQVLAESTQRLSESAKKARPEIDWYKISGLRNILVHDYLGIDIDTVWNILERDLPQLKPAVKNMLE
ncbi:MAG: DUF86 domain-containing protein [Sedimentisphaerales bacterium]|nr:DUF86 domain-containing protein [Sedimentisphaerales bacterium]